MSEFSWDQLLAGGWITAALRLAFIGLIYLFLFLLFRSTVRELALAARDMPDGRLDRLALQVEDKGASSLALGATLPLGATAVIGRGADCGIIVDDPHVSLRHAEIRFERGHWWLRDLGSRNGTIVNGEPVRAVVGVRLDDVLQCGRVRFRLVPSFSVPNDTDSA